MKKIIIFVIAIVLSLYSICYSANAMEPEVYSFTIVDPIPCRITDLYPAKGAVNVSREVTISFHVKDDESGVDINSIKLIINGQLVVPTITGNKNDYLVVYTPSVPFNYGQTVSIVIEADDLL